MVKRLLDFLNASPVNFLADNAHAWHPNYSEKYDPTNHPVLGGKHIRKHPCIIYSSKRCRYGQRHPGYA